MKAKQKLLASDIISSIETKIGEAGETTKKMKKSIEKSADKLAKKLAKLMDKNEKKKTKLAKPDGKKAKKNAAKAEKNLAKGKKNAKRKADANVGKAAKATVTTADISEPAATRPAPPRPETKPAAKPAPTRKPQSPSTANKTVESVGPSAAND